MLAVPGVGSVLGGGGGGLLGGLAEKALGAFLGGTRQQTTVSQATSVSVASSPVIGISIGGGAVSPTGGGGATGTASAPASAQQPGDTVGTSPYSGARVPTVPSGLNNAPLPVEAGLFGGDGQILLLLGGAALLYFLATGKG